MTKLNDLQAKWMKEPAYKQAYDTLEDEIRAGVRAARRGGEAAAMALAGRTPLGGMSHADVPAQGRSVIERGRGAQSTPSPSSARSSRATGDRRAASTLRRPPSHSDPRPADGRSGFVACLLAPP